MKYMKTAAALAGSVMALAAGAPAFAAQPAAGPNFSLNGSLDQALASGELLAQPPVGVAGPQVDALKDAVGNTLRDGELTSDRNLLGGLPLTK
ncbi:hypothetical protein MMF93_22775 [Streptomyces tubbatahanensis]|uniref:Secreted protein n=1 Tax=Streptomyces tubbatahanensis TaxID=2923272 RepID=A0ABY3XWT0_9ACTN|nr:hypothetical protein [Streptomyces tubbatahanensis]UNS98968.1 hypothetical protein MMF93_22775 [Streptomyces tubbatahanensis]